MLAPLLMELTAAFFVLSPLPYSLFRVKLWYFVVLYSAIAQLFVT